MVKREKKNISYRNSSRWTWNTHSPYLYRRHLSLRCLTFTTAMSYCYIFSQCYLPRRIYCPIDFADSTYSMVAVRKLCINPPLRLLILQLFIFIYYCLYHYVIGFFCYFIFFSSGDHILILDKKSVCHAYYPIGRSF